jgi:hypothetical protein
MLVRLASKSDVCSREQVIDEHLNRLSQLFAELLSFALSNTECPKRRMDVF